MTTLTLDSIASFRSLVEAAHGARRGKHLTRASAAFFVDLERRVLALQRELLSETWRPGPFRSFVVADPKPRLISAAPFGDRVVHHALAARLGPRLEAIASDASFACRVGRGTIAALDAARLNVARGGYFLKLDVRRYFETIDHGRLGDLLAAHVTEPGASRLVHRIIDAGAPGSPPGRGLPIGNLTSQHLANFYLTGFDHEIVRRHPEAAYVRYMDDLLFIAPDRATIRELGRTAGELLEGDLRLELKAEATRRGRVDHGVPFLGFRLWPGHNRLDHARKRRLGRMLRGIDRGRAASRDDERAAARAAATIGWALHGEAHGLLHALTARLGP